MSNIPGEQSEDYHNLLTKDDAFETRINCALMFSFMNGYAGLGGISLAGPYKFLSRYGNIFSAISLVAQSQPNYVAKALAEHVFKAAIEAHDVPMVQRLLEAALIDVNSMVCKTDGRKFTAIELAPYSQNIEIIKALLDAGANVDGRVGPKTFGNGALMVLLDQIMDCENSSGVIVTSDDLAIARLLLQSGAEVHIAHLTKVLPRHSVDVARPLVHLLIGSLPRSLHTEFISQGLLSIIAQQLDDSQTADLIKYLIRLCDELHRGECLSRFKPQLESALVQGAWRGHLHVVQLLLPYSESVDSVLSASIHSGNREVVELVLIKNSNFTVPTSFERGLNRAKESTTPLAEAIGTQDATLIELCEINGALRYLGDERNFEHAIAAAVNVGNIAYVHKLVQQYCPTKKCKFKRDVLSPLIERNEEETFFKLLDVGGLASCEHGMQGHTPLQIAMEKRNPRIVRAILDVQEIGLDHTDLCFSGSKTQGNTVFDEAIRWADRSIIEDLCYAFPGISFGGRCKAFTETVLAGNKEMLEFLVNHNLVDKESLNVCLRDAIEGPLATILAILDHGADPADGDALARAVKYPVKLRLLVERISSTQCAQGSIGNYAVKIAIEKGLSGLSELKVLLASNVVNFRGFGNAPQYAHINPLGVALLKSKDNQENVSIVKALLDAGCDVNDIVARSSPPHPDDNKTAFYQRLDEYPGNKTALLIAIETRIEDLVQLLIECGADVNAQARLRVFRTPLQRAAEMGCLETVQMLIQKGADVNAAPARH